MGQSQLADTRRFMEAITGAKTGIEVQSVLLDLAGRYGFSTAFGGVVPPMDAGPAEVDDFVLIQHLPRDWARRYNSRQYLFRDPVFHRLMRARLEHFTWGEAYAQGSSKADTRLIAGEAAEFGLNDGLVIPIELLDGCKAAVSFGGNRPDYGPADIGALTFATSCVMGQLLIHRPQKGYRTTLSRRELDCLSWAAEGKSDWEIGVILGVAASTVQKHILAVKTKLGAATRGHAIAKAFRLNLFR